MNTPLRSTGGKSKIRRTPYSSGKRSSAGCYAPFKSPGGSSNTPVRKTVGKVDLAKEVMELQKQIEEKDVEIEQLRKDYDVSELQEHIDKLHEYNEIKDVAQMVIGRLAELKGTTTRNLYASFGLDVND